MKITVVSSGCVFTIFKQHYETTADGWVYFIFFMESAEYNNCTLPTSWCVRVVFRFERVFVKYVTTNRSEIIRATIVPWRRTTNDLRV